MGGCLSFFWRYKQVLTESNSAYVPVVPVAPEVPVAYLREKLQEIKVTHEATHVTTHEATHKSESNQNETVTVAYCREKLKEILGTGEKTAPVNDWREKLELNKNLKRDIIGTKRSECGRFHIPNPKSPKSLSDFLSIKHRNLLELNLIQVNLFSDWGGRTLLKETCPNLFRINDSVYRRIRKIFNAPSFTILKLKEV